MTHPDTLTIPRAVVEQALAALLEGVAWREGGRQKASTAIDALRAALQPQADTSVLQAAPWPPQAAADPSIPAGFALVPIQTTRAMEEVFAEEGWEWANLLAAAEAVTLEQYEYALSTPPPATQAEPVIPAGFALVPIRATAAMVEAFYEEGWEWANVLAAAEAVTEGEYEAALEGTPPATQADNWNEVEAYQAALTAALGALKRLAKRDGWKPFVTEDANDQWKPAEQDGLDAIAQLEALGE